MRARSILETVVYSDDLGAAETFYTEVVGLELVSSAPGRHLFLRCGSSMFLVFNPESTSAVPVEIAGAAIPMHGAIGAGHAAFRVPEDDISSWRAHLERSGVPIESEVEWPGGGRSLYVRDPAGNSVEFATASLWGLRDVG